jgi:hypothetical protein
LTWRWLVYAATAQLSIATPQRATGLPPNGLLSMQRCWSVTGSLNFGYAYWVAFAH